jgi:hypothetical protein
MLLAAKGLFCPSLSLCSKSEGWPGEGGKSKLPAAKR